MAHFNLVCCFSGNRQHVAFHEEESLGEALSFQHLLQWQGTCWWSCSQGPSRHRSRRSKKKKKKEAVPLSISSVPCADVPAVDMPAASQSRKCRTSCDWTRKTGEQASCVCCNNYGAYAGWWHHGFEPKHFHYLIEAKHMILFVTISVNVHYLVITIHSVKEKKIFIVILPADVFRNTEMGKNGSSR